MDGVTDDGWKYLDDDMIIACYKSLSEWISQMRRMAVAAEYIRATTQGDMSMEEEISNEEEDTEEDTEL